MTETTSQKLCGEVFWHFVSTPTGLDLLAQAFGFKSAGQCTRAATALNAYVDTQEPLPCYKCGTVKRGYNIRRRKGQTVAICFRCDPAGVKIRGGK